MLPLPASETGGAPSWWPTIGSLDPAALPGLDGRSGLLGPLGLFGLGAPSAVASFALAGDGAPVEAAATTVQGRRAAYGIGGDETGAAVVVLPAWGLTFRSYQRSLRRLTGLGFRVVVPSLPGLGSGALPAGRCTLEGCAAWVADLLDAIGVREPAFVIGHSLGAGVAVQLAHDAPDRVGYLVLVDSVATSWSTPAPLGTLLASHRPLVSWWSDAWKQFLPFPEGLLSMQAVAEDLTRATLSGGSASFRLGEASRRRDLSVELDRLRARGQPLMILANDDDALIPDRCFQTLAAVMGSARGPSTGEPSWLLSAPEAFGALVNRVAQIQRARHLGTGRRSSPGHILELLAATDVPGEVAAELVGSASPLWLLTDQPDALATDLALCHPPLARGELRAAARPAHGSRHVRLTVVAADRPGLLADTAAVLAEQGCSVTAAAACTWSCRGLALHTVTFDPGPDEPDGAAPRWEELGRRLRAVGRSRARRPAGPPPFKPIGPATVTVNGCAPADQVVEITAPDCVGLLWAVCQWFADHGISISSASVTTSYGVADNAFVVRGDCDAAALAAYLSPPRAERRA